MKEKLMKKETLWLAIIALSLVPILAISRYNYPSSDDFSYSYRVYQVIQNGGGVFEIIGAAIATSVHYMSSWQGLYTSAFLLALQPGVFGTQYYGLTCLFLLVSIFAGVHVFFYGMVRRMGKPESKSWKLMSVLTSAFLIQCMPSPVDGIFWFNGAVNYNFMWALMMAYIGMLFLAMENESTRGLILKTAGLCLLAFLLSGGNHVTALVGFGISLLFAIYGIFRKKWYYLVNLAFGAVGFLLNVTSPGTAKRRSAFTEHPGIPETVKMSIKELLSNTNQWLTISLVLFLLILLAMMLRLVSKCRREDLFAIHPLPVLVISGGILLGMTCVPYYVMGNFGAMRLTDVIWETFVLLIIFNLWNTLLWMRKNGSLIGQIAKSFQLYEEMHSISMAAVGTLMLLALVILGNSQLSTGLSAAKDLKSGTAAAYFAELQTMTAMFEDESVKDVTVAPLSEHPALLFHKELSEDPEATQNRAVARYYSKDSVRVVLPEGWQGN